MRWRSKHDLRSSAEKLRVVKKFLLLPRTFDSIRTRWLETAWIVERVASYSYDEGFSSTWYWQEIGFADEPMSSMWKISGTPVYDLHVATAQTSYPDVKVGQLLTLEEAINRELPVLSWQDYRCPCAPYRREYLFVKSTGGPERAPPPPPPCSGTGKS